MTPNETLQYPSAKKWTLATFLGWLIGFALALMLTSTLESAGVHNLQFFLGAGMAAGIGFMQWRVLGAPADKRWIWYSVIGLGGAYLFFDLLKLSGLWKMDGGLYILLSTGLGGIVAGWLQRKLLGNPNWVFASVLGWLAAALTVSVINFTNGLHLNNLLVFLINLTSILGGGLVLGVVTAPFLKARE